MDIKLLDVYGLAEATTAMRLSYNSAAYTDSIQIDSYFTLGRKDYQLAMKLIQAGPDHRKFLRLIDGWIKIKAPLYWWKQFDTYRFGVDKVSESTMHTLLKNEIVADDFEGKLEGWTDKEELLEKLNDLREAKNFEVLNRMLPQSYLQTRIVKCSYEALHNMYQARKNHKLLEWREFCKALEHFDFPSFITGEYDQQYFKPKVNL